MMVRISRKHAVWSYQSVLQPDQLVKQLPAIRTLEVSGIVYRLIWDKVTSQTIKLIASRPGRNSPGLHLKATITPNQHGSLIQFREPLLRNEILLVAVILIALAAFVSWLMWSTFVASISVAWTLLTFYLVFMVPIVTYHLFRWHQTRTIMKPGLCRVLQATLTDEL